MSANCIICSDLFDEINPVCSAICGHVYHTNCVTTWVNRSNSCPCCRIRLTLNDIKKIYFNFQSRSDNSFLGSSELQNEISNLKSQLLSKIAELTACKKEKNDTVVVAQKAEKTASELQQTVRNLQSIISKLHFRLESMTALESKVLELERINKALSSDLEYFKNLQSIVSGSLKDAENKIKFYEEAMAVSNDKKEKHSETGMSSGSSMRRTPVTSKVSTAKRSASAVNLSVKKKSFKQTPPGTSSINNKSMERPSISLPEEENSNEVEIIDVVIRNATNQEIDSTPSTFTRSISLPEDENSNKVEIVHEVIRNATNQDIVSTPSTSLSREKQEPRRSDRITARRNEACEETASSMSISEIVQGLQSSDTHIRYAAAQSVRKILTEEKCPPIDKIIEAGVVPSLVACLKDNVYDHLQLEACCALNFLSKTSTQTQIVVQAGAVPIFIRHLSSPDVNVAMQAVWALGNIAGDCPRLRDLVIDHGVIHPLLSLLTPDISTSFRRKITWTLSNLCRDKNPDLQVIGECLPAFAQLISHKDPETVADGCWAIYYLTDGPNERIQQVIDAGVVPRLVELLHEKEVLYIIPAIKSIGNIATGEDLQTQAVIDAGALIPLKKLISHENLDIVKEVCWTISNITVGNVQQIQAVIDVGIMELIIKVLHQSDFKCQKEAAWAVTNLTVEGSLEQTLYIAEAGVIAPICNLLTVRDPIVVNVLLDSLDNILSATSKMGIKHIACSIIEQCGGLDKIKSLKHHRNKAVSKTAIAIINSYFSADNPLIAPKRKKN